MRVSFERTVPVKLSVALLMSVLPLGSFAAPNAPSTRDAPWDPAPRLAVRQGQQTRSAATQRAFHEFRFTDRVADSRITFRSHAVEDVGKHNKPIQYDHGTGVAAADVDGDGLADLYFVSQAGGNELWRNLGHGKFENITASAGVGLRDKVCVAAAFADIDNDGDPDLFVTTVRGGNVLFENLAGRKFREISHDAGVDYAGHSSGIVFFDFNNDSLLDLFVCNVGKYTTDRPGVGGYYIGITNGFYGHLYPKLSERSILYQNLGGRRFGAMPPETLNTSGWSGEAAFADINGDGFPDLYVLNMQGDDHLYVNEGGQRFVDKTDQYFPKTPWGSMGLKFLDFNNDGLIDLFITDMHSDMTTTQIELQRGPRPGSEKAKSEQFCKFEWSETYLQGSSNNIFGNALWKNLGGGKFIEVSDELGAETWWPWGPSVGDVNADGFVDIFVTAGMGYPFTYAFNNLLLNEQGASFIDSECTIGIEPRLEGRTETDYFLLDCGGADKSHPLCQGQNVRVMVEGTVSSRSSVVVDLDNDGDLDLVTNEINDRPQIFISDLAQKKKIQFLKVKLVGTKSNRDGLGSIVSLTAGGLRQTQQHDAKSGYLSLSSLPLYFALEDGAKIDRVEVAWPSGRKQVLEDKVSSNSLVTIVEPND
ncbi:MAG: CRTAC1 family protein [Verrucomicrobiales bacterium]|nr:CRTAC1 family protein [Verrucomicrobiales bacterium]